MKITHIFAVFNQRPNLLMNAYLILFFDNYTNK